MSKPRYYCSLEHGQIGLFSVNLSAESGKVGRSEDDESTLKPKVLFKTTQLSLHGVTAKLTKVIRTTPLSLHGVTAKLTIVIVSNPSSVFINSLEMAI